jgi:L-lactate utilization protein LutB
VNVEKTLKNLRAKGYKAVWFETGAEAADYVAGQLRGETVGIGGSKTVESLGLYERLKGSNEVFWHWKQEPPDEARRKANAADVYLSSANGLAETGEIVNIDGTGNRLAGTMFEKKKVFFLIGKNKVEETYEKALWRARNIASPMNARRFQTDTPCVKGEMRCYDCDSPARICKALLTFWCKPNGVKECEVILIGEDLGY